VEHDDVLALGPISEEMALGSELLAFLPRPGHDLDAIV
jgi:hypothetical protein